MNKGDIVQLPSGKPARHEGGDSWGAVFTYLDDKGKPMRRNGEPDTVTIRSIRLLARLQPEVA